jgi:hypothetical protein
MVERRTAQKYYTARGRPAYDCAITIDDWSEAMPYFRRVLLLFCLAVPLGAQDNGAPNSLTKAEVIKIFGRPAGMRTYIVEERQFTDLLYCTSSSNYKFYTFEKNVLLADGNTEAPQGYCANAQSEPKFSAAEQARRNSFASLRLGMTKAAVEKIARQPDHVEGSVWGYQPGDSLTVLEFEGDELQAITDFVLPSERQQRKQPTRPPAEVASSSTQPAGPSPWKRRLGIALDILADVAEAYVAVEGGAVSSPPMVISNDVIESRIEGEFKGWSGGTIFKLQNGQVWRQTSYAYMYKYAYGPKVTIVPRGTIGDLYVEGVRESVKVERLR